MKKILILVLIFIKLAKGENYEQVKMILHGKFKDSHLGNTIDHLLDEFEYSEEDVVKAYEFCIDEGVEEGKMLACFIAGLYRQMVLRRHKSELCISEYMQGTYMDCLISCFKNYTPECFKCVGNHLPGLIECFKGIPYEYQ